MGILGALIETCLDIIYPPQCPCCKTVLEINNVDLFCVDCSSNLMQLDFEHHSINPISDHFWGRVQMDHSICLWGIQSEGHCHRVIHLIKYGGKENLAIELGRKLGLKILKTSWATEIDGLVPVPIHWRRKYKRGYNQSELIAKGIHEITKIPLKANLIQRVRHTISQTGKNRHDRMENLKNSMKLKEGLNGLKHVLVIDDVLTTGSTLEKTITTLTAENDVKISVAVVAVGGLG